MNNPIRFVGRLGAIAVFVSAFSAVLANDLHRLEMWEEPSHQLVFEDGPVRLLDVRIAPGVTSEFHLHRFATVYVVIQDAFVAGQPYGESWSGGGPRAYRAVGSLMERSDYVDSNLTHRVRNDDDRAFHLFAVVSSAVTLSTRCSSLIFNRRTCFSVSTA